eukprot:m.217960 g.217960  ORF g.217960 m.217960 type:complete len:231 (-) comp25697_c2_seq22:416-1108(-)
MGSRKDGRETNQLRPLACEVGVLSRVDGSARYSHGDACVLASVAGPSTVGARDELSDRATLEVICKPKTGVSGLSDRVIEQRIAHVLSQIVVVEAHPRTTIRCVIQEVNTDGGYLACAINAVCLALMDAGIPLRCCVTAASLSMSGDGDLSLDPTAAEEKAADATFVFAFVNGVDVDASSAPIMCLSSGNHTIEKYTGACDSARRAAAVIMAFFRKSAERRLARAKVGAK